MIMKLTEKRKKRIDKVAKLYGIPSVYSYSKKVAQIILTTLLAVLLTISVIGFPILLIKDCAEDNVTTAYAETVVPDNITTVDNNTFVSFYAEIPLVYYSNVGNYYSAPVVEFRLYDNRLSVVDSSNQEVFVLIGSGYSGVVSFSSYFFEGNSSLAPVISSVTYAISYTNTVMQPNGFLTSNFSVQLFGFSDSFVVYVADNSNNYQVVFEKSIGSQFLFLSLFSPYSSQTLIRTININTSLNDAYNSGVSAGADASYPDIYANGVRDGKEQGIQIGREQVESTIPQIKNKEYIRGYNQAVEDNGSPYTFDRLLDSIFYAPLKAISSVLNFEILGVNLYNLVSALFTLLIVIIVVKLVVGFI